MTACLRFIGVINAAVWLGAAVLMTFFIAPAVLSNPMYSLFGGAKTVSASYYSGEVISILFDRYYFLQYCCAGIAAGHLLAEWIITGRPIPKLNLWLLAIMAGLTLICGLLVQPKLHEMHQIRMGVVPAKPAEKAYSTKWFGPLHGGAEIANLIVCLSLIIYTWRVANPPSTTRFSSAAKFRS